MIEDTTIWLTLLLLGVAFELYAIVTNRADTLSEKIWKVSKKHWLWRLALAAFLVWAFVHLVFGPCAFGIWG